LFRYRCDIKYGNSKWRLSS